MGLCYSLRSRLAQPYGGEADGGAAGEHGDPQVRHRLRQDLLAKERADKKRSKSIDKTLKAEKREYKQTHRLLLLGLRLLKGSLLSRSKGNLETLKPSPFLSPSFVLPRVQRILQDDSSWRMPPSKESMSSRPESLQEATGVVSVFKADDKTTDLSLNQNLN